MLRRLIRIVDIFPTHLAMFHEYFNAFHYDRLPRRLRPSRPNIYTAFYPSTIPQTAGTDVIISQHAYMNKRILIFIKTQYPN